MRGRGGAGQGGGAGDRHGAGQERTAFHELPFLLEDRVQRGCGACVSSGGAAVRLVRPVGARDAGYGLVGTSREVAGRADRPGRDTVLTAGTYARGRERSRSAAATGWGRLGPPAPRPSAVTDT
ncbi:hypothetical protein ACE1SV_71930 [Streptomyces sennicomposti]